MATGFHKANTTVRPLGKFLWWSSLLVIFAVFMYFVCPLCRQRASLVSDLNAISESNLTTEREISEINRNISRLDDPEYVEHLANKERYIRKGEIVYEYVDD